jgi:hypothetical protein
MKKLLYIFLLITIVSCSKTKKLHDRLIGEWNIESVEGTLTDSIYTFDFSNKNAGMFQFREVLATAQGGKYSFIIYDTQRNQTLASEDEVITWENNGNTVTTDNNDGKKIIWNISLNTKSEQIWSASFPMNKSGSKILNITKMVLKKK